MRYQAQNLDVVTLATAGIDASQTTLPLATDEGAKLASTASNAGSYPLAIWNSSTYHNPHDDPNVEIVLVTSHDGASDTITTIARGQESTSAVVHNTSGITYKAVAGFTKGMFDWLVPTVTHQTAPKVSLVNPPGANLVPTGWSNYQVYACPTSMQAQLISKLCFNVTNNTFDATSLMAVGLYDSSKDLLCETGWINVDAAGNKAKTLSTAVFIKSGMFYVAWSGVVAGAGAFYAEAFTSITEQPFMNFDIGVVGKSNQVSSAGSAGDPAMPATLGTIATHTNNMPVAVVQFT